MVENAAASGSTWQSDWRPSNPISTPARTFEIRIRESETVMQDSFELAKSPKTEAAAPPRKPPEEKKSMPMDDFSDDDGAFTAGFWYLRV
jgi:hypothetical protein